LNDEAPSGLLWVNVEHVSTPIPAAKLEKLNSAISGLEKARSSRVIVYITGNKKPEQLFATQVGADVLPLFKRILEELPAVTKKITLALNTPGGHLEAVWPLVNLIREYCETFEVVVLDKALSAGTLIATGADKIVMMPYSHLSPVDPAKFFADKPNEMSKVEIEDVIGFVDFIKDKVGISDDASLADVIKELAKEISPTKLGSINRTHRLIRSLTRKLLELHQSRPSKSQTRQIGEHLTEKLYAHSHLINRREARTDVGFGKIIEFSDEPTKKAAEKLHAAYLEYLQINTDFDPLKLLAAEAEKKLVDLPRAVVHSKHMKFSFESSFVIAKLPDPAGQQKININKTSEKWSEK
jgi:hypothetical protein